MPRVAHAGDPGKSSAASRRHPGSSGYVAVIGQWKRGTDHGKVPLAYTHAVSLAGAEPKVLSTFGIPAADETPQDVEVVDGLSPDDRSCLRGAVGLLIPGGGDIDPAFYGEPRHAATHGINRKRDLFEFALLDEALDRNMPVLAICHGMQLLNVHLGGTLEQHLADNPDRLDHDRDRPRAEPAHGVRVARDGILADLFSKEDVAVNSHHHQGLGRVAEALNKVAWAGDGVLEAVESREHSWVVGVQWHPESMAPVDKRQLRLFEAFVEATHAYAERIEPSSRSA